MTEREFIVPMSIEERIARIEHVLQAVADGTKPWIAARTEFESERIPPDAVLTISADGIKVSGGTQVGPKR